MRERLVAIAVDAFAERGFAATSMREIAAAAGITNASLLHHYPGKPALYGVVLERIADSLSVWSEPPDGTAEDRLVATVGQYFAWSCRHEKYARILMRELLDNHDRAGSARRWYLGPAVRRMIERVEAAQQRGELGRFDAAMLLAHQIGGVAYFVAAEPTLRRILGLPRSADLMGRFQEALSANLRALLQVSARPARRAGERRSS